MKFYILSPRWSAGPRVNGVEPILVIFEDKKEKDQVWCKLRDNLRAKTNIVVTQDSSTKRQVALDEKDSTEQKNGAVRKTSKKMAIVKPNTKTGDSPVKKTSTTGKYKTRTLSIKLQPPPLLLGSIS